MDNFKRKTFQKQQIEYNPRQDDGNVGPALPPQFILDKAQETSSEDEDDQILQNDPIYQQALQNKNSNNNKIDIKQTAIQLNNQQIADHINQTEAQKKFREQQLAADKLFKKKQLGDSSSDEDDEQVLKNDPVFQMAMMGQQQQQNQIQEKKNQLIQEHKSGRDEQEEIQGDIKEDNYISQLKKKIPYSMETVLKGHTKLVTSLAIDNKGQMLCSGSYDYFMRMWDFDRMNESQNCQKLLEPIEGHPIGNISFSNDGQQLLVTCGDPQFKLVSRLGQQGHQSVKGDMYITDMNKTKGHVSEITDGKFHPIQNHIFATSSQDASIRIWDTNQRLHGIQQQMTQKNLIKCTDVRGQKVIVNTISYSVDGKYIFAGCQDGSLSCFQSDANFHRAQYQVRGAHKVNEKINSIECFEDGNRIVSKSLDGSMKIWDIRKFQKPLIAHYNLESFNPGTKVCISPCQKIIVTGHTEGKQEREKVSYLDFFSADQNVQIEKISVGEQQITDIKWNKSINQIVYGIGKNINMLFDDSLSKKGAMMFLKKTQKRKCIEDLVDHQGPAYTPNAMRLFRENVTVQAVKKQMQDEADKLLPKKKIDYGPGKQGNVKASSSVIQYLVKEAVQIPGNREDAREALLKVAEEAERNPMYFKTYKISQPKPVFDEETAAEDESRYLSTIKEICAHCGLKLCICAKRTQYEEQKQFTGKKFGDEFDKYKSKR